MFFERAQNISGLFLASVYCHFVFLSLALLACREKVFGVYMDICPSQGDLVLSAGALAALCASVEALRKDVSAVLAVVNELSNELLGLEDESYEESDNEDS